MQDHEERDDQPEAENDAGETAVSKSDTETSQSEAGEEQSAGPEDGGAADQSADHEAPASGGEAPATDDAEDGESENPDSDAGETAEEELPELEIPELKQILEGAILAADKPLSIDNMISLFAEGEQPSRKQVRASLEEIEADFDDRGFELKQVSSGYRFQVRERYGDWIGRLWEEKPPRYTRALLETLALIAYKQPITRGDVEEIRGVAVSTNIIRTLLEREWIRVVGHRDVPGKPAIYATTKTFLDYFNLTSLDELPTLSEIKDLEGANEELALDDEIIAPRSLELEAGEGAEDVEAAKDAQDDADLDEVTDQVNTIQENIRNLFAQPADEPDLDDLDDDLDQAPVADAAALPAEEKDVAAGAAAVVDAIEAEADAAEAKADDDDTGEGESAISVDEPADNADKADDVDDEDDERPNTSDA